MAKITAKTALNVTKLNFAKLLKGENLYGTEKTIRVDYKDTKERDRINGNFEYDAGSKTVSGTATTWLHSNYKTHKLLFKFEKVKMSAGAILKSAKTKSTKDDRAIIEKALGKNDFFDGSAFADVLYGYKGNDTFQSGGGADTVDGGVGRDMSVYSGAKTPVVVTLNEGKSVYVTINGVQGDKLRNVEGITSGSGNDKLNGDKLSNTFIANAGNDSVNGNGGHDTIDGGDGNDTINGGTGNDSIKGGKGNDSILGGSGNDKIDGGDGNDIIDGGKGNDTLLGGAGNDSVFGGKGNDSIDGGKGSDTVRGGAGNDTLIGGKGLDTIEGGAGKDSMTGGTSADTFRFAAITDTFNDVRDVITDFVHLTDKIDVSAIDAITSIVAADDAFLLDKKGKVSTAVAEGHIGWYQVNKTGTANDRTFIRINNDADAAVDTTIELKGVIKLQAVDFIL